jgi:hypothetical protein
MRWPLLFLVACGGSDAGLLDLGEASAPETSVSTVMDGSRRADSPSIATPQRTPLFRRFRCTTTSTTTIDASEKLTTDTSILDVASVNAYDCNLTCEPMCIRLKEPMHACCRPRQQCECASADAGGYCAP